jgi:hypothetical protein
VKSIFRLSACIIATISFSAASMAATVTNIQGSVFVNTGTGFQPVTGSVQAGPGATVMASPGGSAKIIYSDCVVRVDPGMVVTITESPCAPPSPGSPPTTLTGVGIGVGAAAIITVIAVNAFKSTKPASP